MFVPQKKLTFLNLPSKRVRKLFVSTVDVQIALPDYPSQMATAYLAALLAGKGIQVLLAFYLVESDRSVFFLPQSGEVAPENVDSMLHEGLDFAESMGFVMADADVHQLGPEQLENYWRDLPICKKPVVQAVKKIPDVKPVEKKQTDAAQSPPKKEEVVAVEVVQTEPELSLEERMSRCKESLGRFLASF